MKTINAEKYIEALNNLIGADHAYYQGDKDVDALVELIVASKNNNPIVKITERGWPGHFIAAETCLFRRNTLLEYGDKKWIVSTVGRMCSADGTKFIPIGSGNRYYETMAFEAEYDGDGYCDPTHKSIDFESNWAIHDVETDSELRANDMHEKVVAELAEKIQRVIKPCPFCGREAKIDEQDDFFWIECPNGHMGVGSVTKEEAIEDWNRRARQ